MRGIHSRAKCIYLAIPPGIMRGGEEKKKKNESEQRQDILLCELGKRKRKEKREEGKGEEKRNYAEERYIDNIYRRRRLLK